LVNDQSTLIYKTEVKLLRYY